MRRQHLVPNALSLGTTLIENKPGWQPLASTEGSPPPTGLLRIYWRIHDMAAPRVPGAMPRVKIGWSVFVANMGQLSNFQYIADAWFGLIEISATSASIQTGYIKGEVQGSAYTIEATIFDTGGVSGGKQFAAYTQAVTVPGPVGPAPPVPAVVSVPDYVVGMRWYDGAGSAVSMVGKDPQGTALQYCQTPAPVAGQLYAPPFFALEPEVQGGTVEVTNQTLADINNGRLTFYYFGDQ